MSRSFTRDFITSVALGLIPGHKIMRALGEREGMGTTGAGEDITRMNDLSPAPTSHVLVPTPAAAGEQMAVVSESSSDAGAASAGASTVEIDYLDASGDEQTTTVTMNGTTGVNLTPSNVRFVQEMHVKTLGSANTTGVAVGPIKIYKTGSVGLVYSMIDAGGNMSMVPHKMVPAGKTLALRMWAPSEAQGKRVAVRIRADCNHAVPPVRQAGVHLFKSTVYLNRTAPGDIPLAYTIPSLSIIKVSGWPDVNGADVGVHWWGVLRDD